MLLKINRYSNFMYLLFKCSWYFKIEFQLFLNKWYSLAITTEGNKIRKKIEKVFLKIFTEQYPDYELPDLTNDTILLETGLDSLGFAMIIVELENVLDFNPFSISDEVFYPVTFGEFIDFYKKHIN